MPVQSQSGTPIHLSDTERAVLRCAIDYYLDEGIEYTEYPGENVEETLQKHHTTATDEHQIRVQPGMDELYQTVFQQYARALQETVDEEEADDSMGNFFEEAFKGVVGKIKDSTGF